MDLPVELGRPPRRGVHTHAARGHATEARPPESRRIRPEAALPHQARNKPNGVRKRSSRVARPTLIAAIALFAVGPLAVEAGFHPRGRGAPEITIRGAYRPGAVPVVLIHGMASSPRSFDPTVARLEADPAIAGRVQFWDFSYDSCAALTFSGASLRSELVRLRWTLDPLGLDPALDRMVLVGQSQGGLLAKMAAQESGWTLWDATFAARPGAIRCTPETRGTLVDAFVTHRVPSVSRLVFIATPHHGTRGPTVMAARLKGAVVSPRRRVELAGPIAEVLDLNGRPILVPGLRGVPAGAVASLGWDSPLLEALARTPIAPDVRAHSIIPQIGTWRNHLETDGVVGFESSHVPWADSEVVVPGSHVALNRPEIAAELGRIIRLHLQEFP